MNDVFIFDSEEQQAINELKAMKPEDLQNVQSDVLKWNCAAKGCKNGTWVKDFGIHPEYYWRKKWINLKLHFFLCGKHNKFFKRLQKSFSFDAVYNKLIDETKVQTIHFCGLKEQKKP